MASDYKVHIRGALLKPVMLLHMYPDRLQKQVGARAIVWRENEGHNAWVAAGVYDGVNVAHKARLKQLVCLIQDEELDRGEVDLLGLDQVRQSLRCCHHQMDLHNPIAAVGTPHT